MIRILFFFLFLAAFYNCTSLVKKETTVKINRLAMVTFYISSDIQDWKGNYQTIDLSLGDSLVLSNLKLKNTVFIDKVVNQFYFLFHNQWNKKKKEKLINLIDYVGNANYLKFFTLKKNDFFDFEKTDQLIEKYFLSPKKIKILPLQKIVKNELAQNNFFIKTYSYQDLAKLAKQLKVNAVMLIKNEVSYLEKENGFYPVIGFQILLVNQKGEVVIKTDQLSKKKGVRFIGRKKLVFNQRKELEETDINIKIILETYQKGVKYLVNKIKL